MKFKIVEKNESTINIPTSNDTEGESDTEKPCSRCVDIATSKDTTYCTDYEPISNTNISDESDCNHIFNYITKLIKKKEGKRPITYANLRETECAFEEWNETTEVAILQCKVCYKIKKIKI